MRIPEIIDRQRRGLELTAEAIRDLVIGYVRGEVPDYQVAAWLMAVCLRGMTPRETADLTRAMVDSGETADLGSIPGRKVDKHSTGGVGDKTTLVLAPLVAACGVPVAKMSGRGLGHTGGTLDKLQSIPGVTVSLSRDRFLAQVREIGLAVAGQTADLVPADGLLYALRDVTATVDSVPLIASSIMSKKIAGGADAIVLDVKVGSGAFMRSYEEALELARAMVRIGEEVGRPTVAVLTNMDEPLGRAVGNALEVAEAVETLSGHGPADLVELCLSLAGEMLSLVGAAGDAAEGAAAASTALRTGKALAKLEAMVRAQGGDPRDLRRPGGLPAAPVVAEVPAPEEGHVAGIDAREIGLVAMGLGAGRARKGETVDPAVGLVLRKKVGDAAKAGEPLGLVHARSAPAAEAAVRRVAAAYRVVRERVRPRPLLLARVSSRGVQNL